MICYIGKSGESPSSFLLGALKVPWPELGTQQESPVCVLTHYRFMATGAVIGWRRRTLQDSFMSFLDNRIEGHSGQDIGQVTQSEPPLLTICREETCSLQKILYISCVLPHSVFQD